MLKRVFDIMFALAILALTLPLILGGALAVKLNSPGPAFYSARRTGMRRVPYTMVKLRTMHADSATMSAISAPSDRRVFAVGKVLRASKIDELPQFWNILKGDMSVVGPRPEDPRIVERAYTHWMYETLEVRPGVTSAGSIFGYLHGESMLDPNDPENSYVTRLLPIKLAIERTYLDRAGFFADLGVILRTMIAIPCNVLGIRASLVTSDVARAKRLLAELGHTHGMQE